MEKVPDTTNDYTWPGFIKETLSDVDGHWSSKRVITAFGMFLFAIAFFATTFLAYKVDSAIMNVMASIILSGLAVTASERFGKSFADPGGKPPGT